MSSTASLDALLALCERYMPPADLALIRSAYDAAAQAHAGVYRKSGEPYIEHPLAVARILAALAVDAHGIAAALLHDTVEDTPLKIEALRAQFGSQIAAIVDGVTKFDAVEAPKIPSPGSAPEPIVSVERAREQKARANAETVHKLFLAMLEDPRVVLLKLADRLHNMRTMEVMSERQRTVKSQEVLDIYAPLAGRIGLYSFKGELEDLAFAFLHPEEFERTVRALRAEEQRRTAWAERMCERMRHELSESGITAAVNWRMKRPYRAWMEAREGGVRIGALGDVITFRVLVESVGECYRALGEIHRLWMPHERIRDYIANMKNNGYQSLHTAVFALDGHLAPIHIRTFRMHRASQHGVATYWLERAAAGNPIVSGESLAKHMPSWVTQLASWEHDLNLDAVDFLSAVRSEVLEEDSVFVFTPRGTVHELPAGATVLDFAYQIHTRVGDQAIGAQIQTTNRDGTIVAREVAIDYVLQTGDVVYVRTDLRSHPQPEWRTIAATRYAREKIARTLRVLKRGSNTETEPESPVLRHPSGKAANVRLALCCDPCPPDEIVAVANGGREITIHRRCCRRLRRIIERRAVRAGGQDGTWDGGQDGQQNGQQDGQQDGQQNGHAHSDNGSTATQGNSLDPFAQPLPASWGALGPVLYRLHLVLSGLDYQGLMYDVTSCVASLGLNVVYTKALANQDRSKALILLTIAVSADVRRDTVVRRLRAVPGVTEVAIATRKGCGEP